MKIPTRMVVLSEKELRLFAQKYAGVQDTYVGSFIYTGDVGSTTVDKLPFDFDDEHSGYAAILAKWLYENKIGFAPVGTYFDRFHIYIPIYPQKMTPLELQEAQLSILEQAGIYKEIENGSGSYYQPMTDTHIIGDIRRVMRLPNTPRLPKRLGGEITCYCTYLPQNFYEMEKSLIYSILKEPHEMETPDFYPRPLLEIVKPLTRQFRSVVWMDRTDQITTQYTPTDPLLALVKGLLRSCIWNSLVSPNPPHFIRVAATIDLRDLAFGALEIFDIFSRLKWIDWNPNVCDYQIDKVLGRTDYKRYGCTKIRSASIPCESECTHRGSDSTWVPIKR